MNQILQNIIVFIDSRIVYNIYHTTLRKAEEKYIQKQRKEKPCALYRLSSDGWTSSTAACVTKRQLSTTYSLMNKKGPTFKACELKC